MQIHHLLSPSPLLLLLLLLLPLPHLLQLLLRSRLAHSLRITAGLGLGKPVPHCTVFSTSLAATADLQIDTNPKSQVPINHNVRPDP